MANNHKPETARRLQNTLTSPMTVKQMRQAIDKDSFIEGTVEVELSEVIDTNLEGFLDLISERLTGSILLEDITYGIAGATATPSILGSGETPPVSLKCKKRNRISYMTRNITIQVRRLRPDQNDLPLPRYMTEDSAGMDLYADLEEEITLAPLYRALIPTGLTIALPRGYEAQIRPRSGLALRSGLTVLNSPGTIDADYRDEVKVLLINLAQRTTRIRHGDRIAQLVVSPVHHARWKEVTELNPTERKGGFGHTG